MNKPSLADLYNILSKDNLTKTRIRNIRFLYKMTQVKFAELLNVNYRTYASWEGSYKYPSSPGRALLIAESNPNDFIKNRKSILNKIHNYDFLKELNLKKIIGDGEYYS